MMEASTSDRLEGPRDFEEKEIDLMSREQKHRNVGMT